MEAGCPECGQRVNVSALERRVIDPASRCTHKVGWSICSDLRRAFQRVRNRIARIGRRACSERRTGTLKPEGDEPFLLPLAPQVEAFGGELVRLSFRVSFTGGPLQKVQIEMTQDIAVSLFGALKKALE
jgi:hypothetical protein